MSPEDGRLENRVAAAGETSLASTAIHEPFMLQQLPLVWHNATRSSPLMWLAAAGSPHRRQAVRFAATPTGFGGRGMIVAYLRVPAPPKRQLCTV